jgi:hypothetical protein
MTHALLSFAAAALVVAYWVICRRRSLVHREKAADLLVAFFEKKGVSEDDKDSAETFYRLAKSWAFLPAATICAFPVILLRMLSKQEVREISKERREISDEVMKMYMLRHPLTGTLSLFLFSVMALCALFIGLLANRLRTIPNPSSVYTVTVGAYHPHKRQ